MKAIVLCAGLGTRLRPITDIWPKPAVPLLGQPIIRHTLRAMKRAGITSLGINTFHLPEVMEQCIDREWPGTTVSREVGMIQGTGGGIRGLRSFVDGDEFVVMNGDVLFDVDLTEVIAEHRKHKAAATMVLLPMPAGEKYATVDIDSENCVRRIAGHGDAGERRLTSWHFSGAHIMSPEVFEFMSPSGAEDINREVYIRMIAGGRRVMGHVMRTFGYWSDLGSPERYCATHRDILSGQVKDFISEPKTAMNYWAHSTADLADVRVSGPAWFGENVKLGKGVHIGAFVSVGAGVQIGEGTRLNRCIVLDGATVPGGELHEDQLFVGNQAIELPKS